MDEQADRKVEELSVDEEGKKGGGQYLMDIY